MMRRFSSPRPVVEEPPQLVREQGHGALGVLARFQQS